MSKLGIISQRPEEVLTSLSALKESKANALVLWAETPWPWREGYVFGSVVTTHNQRVRLKPERGTTPYMDLDLDSIYRVVTKIGPFRTTRDLLRGTIGPQQFVLVAMRKNYQPPLYFGRIIGIWLQRNVTADGRAASVAQFEGWTHANMFFSPTLVISKIDKIALVEPY